MPGKQLDMPGDGQRFMIIALLTFMLGDDGGDGAVGHPRSMQWFAIESAYGYHPSTFIGLRRYQISGYWFLNSSIIGWTATGMAAITRCRFAKSFGRFCMSSFLGGYRAMLLAMARTSRSDNGGWHWAAFTASRMPRIVAGCTPWSCNSPQWKGAGCSVRRLR